MADVVNIADSQARDLPARIGHALAVRELITLSSLAGSPLLAGAGGLDQIVARVNVIEVLDILPWVNPTSLCSPRVPHSVRGLWPACSTGGSHVTAAVTSGWVGDGCAP